MSDETKTQEATPEPEPEVTVSLSWWLSQAITEFCEGALRAARTGGAVGLGVTTQVDSLNFQTLLNTFLAVGLGTMLTNGLMHFGDWHRNGHHLPNLFGKKP